MSGVQIGGVTLSATRPRVIASFWEMTSSAELSALAARGLELVEIRLDKAARYDDDSVQTNELARALCESFSALPTLLTIRLAAEGGDWRGGVDEQRRMFFTALPFCDAVDIELASPLLPDIAAAAREQNKTLVVSRHNFAGADDATTLDTARTAAFAAGADIFKTAGLCTSEEELQTLAAFAMRCRADFPPCAVIGMSDGGENIYARRARLELPALGSCLAFAAIDEGSAPGQLSLDETAAAVRAVRTAITKKTSA